MECLHLLTEYLYAFSSSHTVEVVWNPPFIFVSWIDEVGSSFCWRSIFPCHFCIVLYCIVCYGTLCHLVLLQLNSSQWQGSKNQPGPILLPPGLSLHFTMFKMFVEVFPEKYFLTSLLTVRELGIHGWGSPLVRLVRLQTDNFRLFLRQQTDKDKLPF